MHLCKRSLKISARSVNTKLVVKHVPISEQESNINKAREKLLQPLDDEEEDEETVTNGRYCSCKCY